MKVPGGYEILLAGRPDGRVVKLTPAEAMYLPLRTRRFRFSCLSVEGGQHVLTGETLATDPQNHGVPLLAPRGGTVNLKAARDHITLENIEEQPAALRGLPRTTNIRQKLLVAGAWGLFSDAHSGSLPDPTTPPIGVIVSTVHCEPFVARGDAQILDRLDQFVQGMVHIQSFLQYRPIHLVIPDVRTSFADELVESVRDCGWVRIARAPARYGCDHPAILARKLAYRPSEGQPVWYIPVAGVFAVERALSANQPCLSRTITLGGPAVGEPAHFEVPIGYPLSDLLGGRLTQDDNVRVINGGVLTGRAVSTFPDGEKTQLGVDAECVGLTVLPEATGSEILGWARPGLSRRSYFGCFAGNLRRRFAQVMSTALRGEVRACISCGACEEVCPAGLMPHLIHKYLYQDLLDDAETAGLNLCVECGLCTYVCPSKIELRSQFIEGKEALRSELPAEEGVE